MARERALEKGDVGEGMTTVAALLRGVNVGGNNMLKMADLKAWLEARGYQRVRTLLQSGNVVLDTADPATTAAAITEAIGVHAGFRPAVVLRTAKALRAILKAAPFPDGADGSRAIITLMETTPDAEGMRRALAYEGPESLAFHGLEMFAYYPDGLSKSELAKLPLLKWLKTQGTARNLNTMRALADLTEA